MTRTRTRVASISTLTKQYYHDNCSPPTVYVLLLRLIKLSCRNNDLTWTEPLSPAITKAIIANQTTLGRNLTLHGYLSQKWMTVIQQIIPKTDQIAHHILLGLWRLFFQHIWDQRNSIKHGPTSVSAQMERDAYLLDIHEWKHNAGT